jgi:phage tail-like protein
MARAQATDPLHNFRFHVRATAVDGIGSDPLQPNGEPSPGIGDTAEAGFQAVSTPEYTVESAEYREGLKTYTEKYPGVPTTNDLSMTRGVSRKDTAFYNWVVATIEGREYRTDLTIFHALRGGRSSPFNADADFTQANAKRYIVRNAWPTRVKIAGDMDASASDVSLAEVDVVFESFDVALPTG